VLICLWVSGEKDTIGKIACAGLANNLISRIRRRPSNQKMTWTLDKYIRGPSSYFTGIRVVSDRATEIPEIQDCGIRQVVVRITSRQTTVTEQVSETRKGKQAVDEEPKVKTQDCTEYLVLQKMLWMGEEQDWRVWGYATPTTVADLDSPWFASGLSLSERLKLMEQTLRK
jgi:protein MBA1